MLFYQQRHGFSTQAFVLNRYLKAEEGYIVENRQYFTEFVIIDGKNNSRGQAISDIGNHLFEIEVDEEDVRINDIVGMAKSKIVIESKRRGLFVSEEQIHFRQFNRI